MNTYVGWTCLVLYTIFKGPNKYFKQYRVLEINTCLEINTILKLPEGFVQLGVWK